MHTSPVALSVRAVGERGAGHRRVPCMCAASGFKILLLLRLSCALSARFAGPRRTEGWSSGEGVD